MSSPLSLGFVPAPDSNPKKRKFEDDNLQAPIGILNYKQWSYPSNKKAAVLSNISAFQKPTPALRKPEPAPRRENNLTRLLTKDRRITLAWIDHRKKNETSRMEIDSERQFFKAKRTIGVGATSHVFQAIGRKGMPAAFKMNNDDVPPPPKLQSNLSAAKKRIKELEEHLVQRATLSSPPPSVFSQTDTDKLRTIHLTLKKGEKRITDQIEQTRIQELTEQYKAAKRESEMLKMHQDIPHLVKWQDSFNAGPFKHCLEMELLPPNFALFLKSNPDGFSLERIADVARQLLETLFECKKKGLIHRDLKLNNIAFDPHSGKVSVYDVGSACRSDDPERSYSAGSTGYRAPELILQKAYDHSIDMWSLGIILLKAYTISDLFKRKGLGGSFQSEDNDDLHCIVSLLGNPPSSFIKDGLAAKDFFRKNGDSYHLSKKHSQDVEPPSTDRIEKTILAAASRKKDSQEAAKAFIALIKKMIAYERITPEEALKDPFFSYFTSKSSSSQSPMDLS